MIIIDSYCIIEEMNQRAVDELFVSQVIIDRTINIFFIFIVELITFNVTIQEISIKIQYLKNFKKYYL